MKIAVPVTVNNKVDNHFGHCDFYEVYSVSDEGKIVERKTIPSLQGCGCKSDIASVLADDGVSVMLAGGIGTGAIKVLNNAGIAVFRGCAGDASKIVEKYISGNLVDSGESCQELGSLTSDGNHHQCSH